MSTTGTTHIWIIEDNRPLREVLAETLRTACDNWTIQAFPSCEDAFKTLNINLTTAPQVVIMDLGLPGMNGLEGITHLKQTSPNTEIVVFTVFDDIDKIYTAICAGASGYLLKSTPPQALVEGIHEVLNGGSPMHPQVARKVLTRLNTTRPPTPEPGETLSDREREVLECMVDGLIKKEIADRLTLSIHTVDNYLRRIYRKLHVNTMQGAVAKAMRDRLV